MSPATLVPVRNREVQQTQPLANALLAAPKTTTALVGAAAGSVYGATAGLVFGLIFVPNGKLRSVLIGGAVGAAILGVVGYSTGTRFGTWIKRSQQTCD